MKTSQTPPTQTTTENQSMPRGDFEANQQKDIRQLLEDMLAELRRIGDNSTEVREIMTVEEAAVYLRLSPFTIRDKISAREIPFYKVDGSVRFRKSRLDKWINRNEKPLSN